MGPASPRTKSPSRPPWVVWVWLVAVAHPLLIFFWVGGIGGWQSTYHWAEWSVCHFEGLP